MTEKLYYNDPHTIEFQANVVEVIPFEQSYAALLENTYFYPTSGGQPFDTGLLNGVKVTDVLEKDRKILHILESKIEIGITSAKIDYIRRLEHMQHHTGQHLLSQAFIRVINAPTISFHLGNETATIEIVIKDLDFEQADLVEELANDIIYQNKKINVHYVDESEISNLSLRKPPKKKGDSGIRVIEIEDFDMSACGGTHATSTGEIGIIKIIGWERYKGNVKVEFICGHRALQDYRFKNKTIKSIANKFSTKDKQIEEIIDKSVEDSKNTLRQLGLLKKELAGFQANELIKNAEIHNENKLIFKVFQDEDINSLKLIGQEIVNSDNTIALLLSVFEKRTQAVLCCNENIKLNMNKYSAEVFKLINGKGGGKPNFVQGSGEITDLNEIINNVKSLLLNDLKVV